MEIFDIDLDLPPVDRWKGVMTQRKHSFRHIIDWIVETEIPKDILAQITAVLEGLKDFWPSFDYREELKGVAEVTGISPELVLLLNVHYELRAGCTSIVARSQDGTVWHGRNLDYDIPHLQDLAIHVKFFRRGEFLYEGTTYAGYIGLLTGMKPKAFSLSMDARVTGKQRWELLLELLISKGKAAAYPFLFRDVFEQIDSYDRALQVLQNAPMLAPAYAIIAGAEQGQGAVVTRDMNAAVDTWTTSEKEWFLVETNDDHWKPPDDTRRNAAIQNMKRYNPETIGSDSLMDVMNQYPTLNSMTTFTTVMSAGNDEYRSILQNLNQNGGDNHFDKTKSLRAAEQYKEAVIVE